MYKQNQNSTRYTPANAELQMHISTFETCVCMYKRSLSPPLDCLRASLPNSHIACHDRFDMLEHVYSHVSLQWLLLS